MSQLANAARLERARSAWNTGDLDGYLALYADDIRLHGYSPEPMDKTEVRAFYVQVFAAFEYLRLIFHETLWDGDRVAIRFTVTGKHVGTFMGALPTGRDIAFDGITVMHFREGRCHERWASADMLGLLVQLGVVSPPGERVEPMEAWSEADASATH